MLSRFGRKKSQPPLPPPPTKSLYRLLNLDPDEDEDRSKYDDRAVIEAVRRNPDDAKRTHKFSAYLNYEYYPLWMAVMLRCSLEAAEALYEAYPNAIKHTDRYGDTVLHYACRYRVSLEVATFLVEKNPSAVKMKDYNGWTPLHNACYRGAPLEVVEMLLERYPPALHIKDNRGNTPLMYAKKYSASPEVISLLEKAEAAAASSSSSSSTPVKPAAAATSITTSSTTPSASGGEKQTKSPSSPQDSPTNNSKFASMPAELTSSTEAEVGGNAFAAASSSEKTGTHVSTILANQTDKLKSSYDKEWRRLTRNDKSGMDTMLRLASQLNLPSQGVRMKCEVIEDLTDLADESGWKLHDFCSKVVRSCGGKFSKGKTKKKDRIKYKVKNDYEGDYGSVLDMERCMGLFTRVSDMNRCLQRLKTLLDNPEEYDGSLFTIKRVKDRINNPITGYRDMLINIQVGETDDFFIGELQLTFEKIHIIKEQAHYPYEIQRELE